MEVRVRVRITIDLLRAEADIMIVETEPATKGGKIYAVKQKKRMVLPAAKVLW